MRTGATYMTTSVKESLIIGSWFDIKAPDWGKLRIKNTAMRLDRTGTRVYQSSRSEINGMLLRVADDDSHHCREAEVQIRPKKSLNYFWHSEEQVDAYMCQNACI